MKVRAMVTTLAASLLFAGAALAAETGWKTYGNSQAGFAVEMPGEAKMSTQKSKSGDLYRLESHVGNVGYHVISWDGQVDLSGSEHARNLDFMRRAILGCHHATAQSERELELNGFPGLEITFRDGKLGTHWVTRIYLVKSYCYEVSTESTVAGTSADGTRFFNSFHPELKTPAAA